MTENKRYLTNDNLIIIGLVEGVLWLVEWGKMALNIIILYTAWDQHDLCAQNGNKVGMFLREAMFLYCCVHMFF
jgi:hypothetical protein